MNKRYRERNKGKLIPFPGSVKRPMEASQKPNFMRGSSVMYILAFLSLMTLTNTYLLKEAYFEKTNLRDVASFQNDTKAEEKLLERLNSFSKKSRVPASLAKAPTLSEKMNLWGRTQRTLLF